MNNDTFSFTKMWMLVAKRILVIKTIVNTNTISHIWISYTE